MTDEKLDSLMRFYNEERHYGKLKYMWEIIVPSLDEFEFCYWLKQCEDLGLTFAFAVIERYKGYLLMYGFSDFEISKRKGIRCMQLNFENNDILYQQFIKWQEDSSYFILPISLKINLELNERLSGSKTKFRLYDDGSCEQPTVINTI